MTETKGIGGRTKWLLTGLAVLAIAALAALAIYAIVDSRRVYIDAASIEAPQIDLSPSSRGSLEAVYVQAGDMVTAEEPVARVGEELVSSAVAGVIVRVDQKIGADMAPGTAAVTMIDPSRLRVVGKVDEDKGLAAIRVGDPVTFTVDAYGGRLFSGVVDEVAPTANSSGVVFNISGERQTQQFDVKARFDASRYPELRNGMSARMWIYKQ